jgi:ketosteroid isomerase-like protein
MSKPEQGTSSTGATASGDVERAVMQIDHEWLEALLGHDIEALERILPEGFIFTDAHGEVLSKDEFLEVIKAGGLTFESIHREEVSLSVFQNTALATGRDTVQGHYKGEAVSGKYRFTNVYVGQQGRWKVVSSQVSRIAQQ